MAADETPPHGLSGTYHVSHVIIGPVARVKDAKGIPRRERDFPCNLQKEREMTVRRGLRVVTMVNSLRAAL